MKKYLVLLFGVMFFFGCKAQNSVKVLTAEEFSAAVKADKKAVVLDVRRPDEFAAGHIEGAVVGAGSVVTKDVEPWSVVVGNPAKFIKKRVLMNG